MNWRCIYWVTLFQVFRFSPPIWSEKWNPEILTPGNHVDRQSSPSGNQIYHLWHVRPLMVSPMHRLLRFAGFQIFSFSPPTPVRKVKSWNSGSGNPCRHSGFSEWAPGSPSMARSIPHDGISEPAPESAGVRHLGATIFQEPTTLGVYIIWKILFCRSRCQPQTKQLSPWGWDTGRWVQQHKLYLRYVYLKKA